MQKDKKDKIDALLDFIIKHSKIFFPVIVVVAVAVTVFVGLSANRTKADQGEPEAVMLASGLGGEQVLPEQTPSPSPEASPEPLQTVSEDVPLTENENPEVYTLLATYYDASAHGDYATLVSIYDELSENELLRYIETSKYLDHYPVLDVYTKPGPAEDSILAYVYYKVCFVNHEEEFPGYQVFYLCRDDERGLYIKSEENFTEEEKEYITTVTLQDDVLEFHNRVTVEYNELMEGHPELLAYLHELGSQVDVAIGVKLAEAGQEPGEEGQSGGTPEDGEVSQGDGAPEGGSQGDETPEGGDVPAPNEGGTPEQPVDAGPQYASASTTVNVRSSDSEQADKLGKIDGGTRIQVQEVRLNGWTKVVYNGSDGYIKSEYLKMEESTAGMEVIGTVTAIDNVKIRAGASLEAESLGVLSIGESLELLANEDGWCKVNFNGRAAYVKAEFVTQ